MNITVLKNNLKTFPKSPGVYIMRDMSGQVIYIGKAKNLRTRIRTYFRGGDGRYQIEYLLKHIHDIETIITSSEEDAFILERDLINRYKPRYNVLLKDDKSYLNVRIDLNQQWPKIELTRKVSNDGALYFGPYSYSYELKLLLEAIKNVIPLRTCSNTVFFNRQRPCLEYEIKRCSGPCCLPVDKDKYRSWIEQAIELLKGKTGTIVSQLEKQMEIAASLLRFEEAAAIRDRILKLKQYSSGKMPNVHHGESRDAFYLYRQGELGSVCLLSVRHGRISDTKNFLMKRLLVSDDEVLEAAVSQYYEGGAEIPEEIVLPCKLSNIDLIISRLKSKKGQTPLMTYPKRGSKYRLLQIAELNAHQSFEASYDEEERYSNVSSNLARLCRLKQIPKIVECVDISNWQGSDIVGAIVAFEDSAPNKSLFRKYQISFDGKPDDVRAIGEVINRRLSRVDEEAQFPDLIIIDGGFTQLQSALRARDDLGVPVEIISLAKARTDSNMTSSFIERSVERVFIEGSSEPILLEPGSDVSLLLEKIRNEAHRFVISFHRNTRARRVMRSLLDEVSGIGPERRKRLFRHFGSVEAMKRASLDELTKEGRMPKSMAEKLKQVLEQKYR